MLDDLLTKCRRNLKKQKYSSTENFAKTMDWNCEQRWRFRENENQKKKIKFIRKRKLQFHWYIIRKEGVGKLILTAQIRTKTDRGKKNHDLPSEFDVENFGVGWSTTSGRETAHRKGIIYGCVPPGNKRSWLFMLSK